jgi:FlaA1/EpsC-like NDP-sugar epimerase
VASDRAAGRSPDTQRRLRDLVTIATLAAAYVGSYLIRFELEIPDGYLRTLALTLPVVVALEYGLLRFLLVHRRSWRFTSLWDVVAITEAMLSAGLLLLGSRIMLSGLDRLLDLGIRRPIPIGVIAANAALTIIGLVGLRALRRLQHEEAEARQARAAHGGRRPHRVVVIGAGRLGTMAVRQLQTRPDLGITAVGFLDDDPAVQRQVIHGVEVLGTREDLPDVVAERRVDQAIIAISDASGAVVRDLAERCHAVGIEPQILPGFDALLGGQVSISRLRPVRIEDLLRRDPVELDTSSIEQLVRGQNVVITGAGGSIGAELCRQVGRFRPRRLVLVERSEGALWAIDRELGPRLEGVEVVPALVDVRDRSRVRALLSVERPSVVFHAAAHKHVPMVEGNPGEAIVNNVFGTKVVVDACAELGVPRFVLVSTDKAVNPSSVMGATKRIAERYVQSMAASTGRPFVSVRFGNVLGSAGSVVPVFEQQIAEGGPVTVTHPDMRRYFMTIPEAAQLVIQAAALGVGGEVFVLDMGEPVRIVDLAEELIRLSGLEPYTDVPIVFCGIRPGEKLFEELALDSEHTDATAHPSIAVSRTVDGSWPDRDRELAELLRVAESGDRSAIQVQLVHLVPEMLEVLDRTLTAERAAPSAAPQAGPSAPVATPRRDR